MICSSPTVLTLNSMRYCPFALTEQRPILSSNSKYAYILSYYIINRDVYKDGIYDVTTKNEAIYLQNES